MCKNRVLYIITITIESHYHYHVTMIAQYYCDSDDTGTFTQAYLKL